MLGTFVIAYINFILIYLPTLHHVRLTHLLKDQLYFKVESD